MGSSDAPATVPLPRVCYAAGMRSARAITLVVLASLLPAATLHAQPAAKPVPKAPPTASAAPTAQAAPATSNDIVRLKSGTSFRGALVEHDPKGRTLLQTAEGTRDFDSNDVAYAGPAAGDTGPGGAAPPVPATSAAPPVGTPPTALLPPTPAPAPVSSAAPAVTGDVVQLNGTSPGIQFHLLGGPAAAGVARPLCVAPCSTQLPAGSYRMALSKGLDSPKAVSEDVIVRANGTLEGSYANKKGARVGGVLLIVAGGIVGLAGLGGLGSSGADKKGLGLLGVLAGGGGVVGGIFLVRTQDELAIRSAEADRVAPRTGLSPGGVAPAALPRFAGQF